MTKKFNTKYEWRTFCLNDILAVDIEFKPNGIVALWLTPPNEIDKSRLRVEYKYCKVKQFGEIVKTWRCVFFGLVNANGERFEITEEDERFFMEYIENNDKKSYIDAYKETKLYSETKLKARIDRTKEILPIVTAMCKSFNFAFKEKIKSVYLPVVGSKSFKRTYDNNTIVEYRNTVDPDLPAITIAPDCEVPIFENITIETESQLYYECVEYNTGTIDHYKFSIAYSTSYLAADRAESNTEG